MATYSLLAASARDMGAVGIGFDGDWRTEAADLAFDEADTKEVAERSKKAREVQKRGIKKALKKINQLLLQLGSQYWLSLALFVSRVF